VLIHCLNIRGAKNIGEYAKKRNTGHYLK
jgi:hypothetical protein